MNNDRQAFIAKIIETPDDDAPRYAYADWLRDQGEDELADFIQMQLANPEPNYDMLRYGNFRLFRKYASDLCNLLFTKETNPTLAPSDTIEVRRGFVESIVISASCFEANAEKILAEHPITEVRLTSLPDILIEVCIDSKTKQSFLRQWIGEQIGDLVGDNHTNQFPVGVVTGFVLSGSKTRHNDCEDCYAEWESRLARIKFVRPQPYSAAAIDQAAFLESSANLQH